MSRTYRQKNYKRLVRDENTWYYCTVDFNPYEYKQDSTWNKWDHLDSRCKKALKWHTSRWRRTLEKRELHKEDYGFRDSEKLLKKLHWVYD